jgi:hypothetical protein
MFALIDMDDMLMLHGDGVLRIEPARERAIAG